MWRRFDESDSPLYREFDYRHVYRPPYIGDVLLLVPKHHKVLHLLSNDLYVSQFHTTNRWRRHALSDVLPNDVGVILLATLQLEVACHLRSHLLPMGCPIRLEVYLPETYHRQLGRSHRSDRILHCQQLFYLFSLFKWRLLLCQGWDPP